MQEQIKIRSLVGDCYRADVWYYPQHGEEYGEKLLLVADNFDEAVKMAKAYVSKPIEGIESMHLEGVRTLPYVGAYKVQHD